MSNIQTTSKIKRVPKVFLKGTEPTIRTRLNMTKFDHQEFQRLQDLYEQHYGFRPSNSIIIAVALVTLSDAIKSRGVLPPHHDLYIAR